MKQTKQFITYNGYLHNKQIEQYKIIIPTHKKILGYSCFAVGVIPNGLGFIFYPLSYMFLSNSTARDLIKDIRNDIRKLIIKIKLLALIINNKRRFA